MTGRVEGDLGARTDARIVEWLVNTELSRVRGRRFSITEWPDQAERTREAVEAIAIDASGVRIALEHTLLQTFPGDREDGVRFKQAIAPLESDPTLRLRGNEFQVLAHPGAIPNGIDWNAVAATVAEYLRGVLATLPEGWSQHSIPCGTAVITIDVERIFVAAALTGGLVVSRWMPQAPLTHSVRIALARNLPKLIAAVANERILVLEKTDPLIYTFRKIWPKLRTSRQIAASDATASCRVLFVQF